MLLQQHALDEKAKAANDILKLNRVMDEFQSSLPQKVGTITYMDQQPECYKGLYKYNDHCMRPILMTLSRSIPIVIRY